jgi:hypothetical protein
MPKIGAKPDDRPFNRRCAHCGCIVEKLVSRFGWDGKPKSWLYRCKHPFHNCTTVEREGCEPVRVYEPVAHADWDRTTGVVEHPGRVEDCADPRCEEYCGHRALSGGERHPGRLADCPSPACEPPF